ncbi:MULTISPECIES: NAD(P)-binding domain-containing protein [unclassified Ruegeria]|uniref:NAD(P)-dependent oxidoreductase n=1 Tax=unclassified Ruegeria TaxID=2625375 RepID=UPI001AEB0E94|nr:MULTISPECIES: NAD(P)-binding domain-containing protein [unclassified Ruegeria]
MSEVSILGLGLMGMAIAKAYQKGGVPITVWNRTIKKAEALEPKNVVIAQTISEAIAASPVSIICVEDPNSVLTLLGHSQVEPILDGRTIIQLSTSLPKQVREDQEWLAERNADFLYGAIHCGPQDLGTKDSNILISGPSSIYNPVEGLLGHQGGKIEYLGDDIAAVSVLDLAWLSTRFGEFMGMLHASNICEAEGVELQKFISMFPDSARIQHHVGTIRDGTYDQRTATLSVWQASLELLKQQAIDAGMDAGFPSHVGGLFEKAVKAGYGDEHVMALFKVLRDDGRAAD